MDKDGDQRIMGGSALNPQQPLVARAPKRVRDDVSPETLARLDADYHTILQRVASGETNSEIGATYNLVGGAFYRVFTRDPQGRDDYDDARRAYADSLVQGAHGLADRVADGDLDPKRAETKIRLAQWHAPRLSPEQYAERKQIEHNHNHTIRLDPEDLRQRLESLASVAHQRSAQPGPITIDHEPITTDKA
jgi:hypothetical protein